LDDDEEINFVLSPWEVLCSCWQATGSMAVISQAPGFYWTANQQ